jgi:leucyl aminopeptidase
MSFPIGVVPADPLRHEADLVAVLVREGSVAKGKIADDRLTALDRALGGLVLRCATEEEFSGKENQVLSLHTHGKVGSPRVALVGLGKERDVERSLDQFRSAAARAVKL